MGHFDADTLRQVNKEANKSCRLVACLHDDLRTAGNVVPEPRSGRATNHSDLTLVNPRTVLCETVAKSKDRFARDSSTELTSPVTAFCTSDTIARPARHAVGRSCMSNPGHDWDHADRADPNSQDQSDKTLDLLRRHN